LYGTLGLLPTINSRAPRTGLPSAVKSDHVQSSSHTAFRLARSRTVRLMHCFPVGQITYSPAHALLSGLARSRTVRLTHCFPVGHITQSGSRTAFWFGQITYSPAHALLSGLARSRTVRLTARRMRCLASVYGKTVAGNHLGPCIPAHHICARVLHLHPCR